MNKPTNITPRDKAEAKDKQDSLLERASGAYGLDKLAPAAVPVMLDADAKTKFAAKRTPTAKVAPVEPAPVGPVPVEPARVEAKAEPERQTAPEIQGRRRSDAQPAVQFSGERHPVSRDLLREQGLIDPDGGASRLLEEFRIVKRQVLSSANAEGTAVSRRVLVCSPHPNEGKTFCALNLALAMAAERDSEVLLIDADFGKPCILSKLGLSHETGFMDVLADPSSHVEDHVIGTDIPGLWVLGAGARTGRDSEYLASERTWEVLNRLTRGAPNRMIVFDSPPALAATPASELAKHVGQALLVARADVTGQVALEDAIDLLSACPDIRLLLNDATFSPSGRKFGSYYGYGE